MTDDGQEGGFTDDPFFAEESEVQAQTLAATEAPAYKYPGARGNEESRESDGSMVNARFSPDDLPPPPEDHADYGLVADAPAAAPVEYEPPPVFEGAPVYVPQAPITPEVFDDDPEPFEGAPVYVSPTLGDPATGGPGADVAPPEGAPPAAGPVGTTLPPAAVPITAPPVALPPEVMPAPLVPPPMVDSPAGMPVVAPVAPQSMAPSAPTTGSDIEAPTQEQDPTAHDGLQGPEFRTMREAGMDNQGPVVGGVLLPTAAAEVEEEVHQSVAEGFSAKPSTMHGRSPVNLASRTTRIGIAAVVLALIAFVVIQFVPSKDATGTPLKLELAKGDVLAYHFDFAMKGNVTVEGAAQTASVNIDTDALMKVTDVDASGNATISTTLNNIRMTVSPKPVIPVPIPRTARSTITVAPNGEVISGDLALSSIGNSGQNSVPGWDGQAFPVFPVEGLLPGDTWKEEVSVPFSGQELTTSAKYRMLDIKTDQRGRLAVISADTTTPLNITVTLDQMLEGSGQTAESLGVPEGIVPTITYGGTMDTTGTYWLNLDTGQLDSAYLTGKINMDMTLTADAESMAAAMTGELTLSIRAQQPPVERKPTVAVATPEPPAAGN